MSSLLIEKIERIINECDKHLYRINTAYNKSSKLLPFDAEKYERLSDEEVEHIDQYLFRFSKLQDAMGTKLFRYILLFLEENIEGKPFIDILNRMEKLSLIKSAAVWRELRDIRNELAHQYDDDAEEMSLVLNKLFKQKEMIESIYLHLKNYYEDKK